MGGYCNRILLCGAILAAGWAAIAVAGPNGPTVVGGSATVSGPGSGSVTINQSSQNAIINWQTFNLATGETATFNQPGASAMTLNRVVGGLGPSFIDGTLTANGRVFIINGDGILIGRNASINTAGFLATTNDIHNDDFMAGRLNFNIPGRPDASIVNLGTITASSGGFAALVAPGVRNSGTITATLGTVALASGNGFTLDFYGDKLITLAVNDQIASKVIDVQTGAPLKSLVGNDGTIKANGGRVELTAAAARAVVDSVINTTGVIEANSIGTRNGMIVLGAATGSSKPAGAPTQTVKVSGQISAAGKDKGTSGGTVVITGENIALAGASIDVSGAAGGGKALIGGDTGGGKVNPAAGSVAQAALEGFAIPSATTLSVDAKSVINASATGSGNGGKVVLWSDQQTSFAGTILAKGGLTGGDGGFAEVSSHGQLAFAGIVDLSAPKGQTGTLLLDPYDVVICQADCRQNISNSSGVFSPTGSPSYLDAVTLQTALASANVLVTTGGVGSTGTEAGNITVGANLTWSSNNSLTLSAYNSIIFNSGATISNTGAGNLFLRADNSGSGSGTVSFAAINQINYSASAGTVSIYYNPNGSLDCVCSKYQFPADYSSYVQLNTSTPVANQLTAYMLVNTVTDLANISTNLGGTYALGTSIDASKFAGYASGTTFNGILDGNGGLGVVSTISNLTLASSQSQNSYGLFPFIGSAGAVRNLNLANISIGAGANVQFVGALAGQNAGTISNVTVVSGTVSAGSFTGIGAGGLVGQNAGTISGSSANVAVSVGDAINGSGLNIAGGLVASNLGMISNSSATGNVSGGAFSLVGGLAGQNGLNGGGFGNITASYAGGAVSVSGLSSTAGGLVGSQAAGSVITDSQAVGSVTSTANGQSQQFSMTAVGGLVGQNSGTIAGSTAPTLTSACVLGAAYVCATGAVSVGSAGQAGGLVGYNDGIVGFAFATGTVNAGDNSSAGGLIGNNNTVGGSIPDYSSKSAIDVCDCGPAMTYNPSGFIFSSFATGHVGAGNSSLVGGLAGANNGAIVLSYATGNVSVAANGGFFPSFAGGLVGQNGNGGNPAPAAIIIDSYATGTVTGSGYGFAVGGLAGNNAAGSAILDSQAFGNVIALASGTPPPQSNQFLNAGGLVGSNQGTILGSTTPTLSSACAQGAFYSCAAGAVSVGSGGQAGGLVAFSDGIIQNVLATGAVTGAAGPISALSDNSHSTQLGGLVATNQGMISYAFATGTVGTTATANLQVGGFVGHNSGTIANSFASGSFRTGNGSQAGGFAGDNAPSDNNCSGCTVGDGYNNLATISLSSATGNVSVGGASIAGGFSGTGEGIFVSVSASGNVSGGANSVLGGLVGGMGAKGPSSISLSSATGAVTANGSNSILGGLVGLNGGTIFLSSAAGPVSGTSQSYIGGLVGINIGAVTDSFTTASASATGSGSQNVVGGLVAFNLGMIDPTTSAGNASSGANSTVGGLIGINGTLGNSSNVVVTNSSFPIGTVSSDSIASGTASGGTGSTVAPQIAVNYAAGLPTYPTPVYSCTDTVCSVLATGQLINPNPTNPSNPITPEVIPVPSPVIEAQLIQNLVQNITLTTVSLTDVVNIQPLTQTTTSTGQPGQRGGPAAPQVPNGLPPQFGNRFFVPPPLDPALFVKDQVVLQIPNNIPQAQLQALLTRLGLSIMASTPNGLLGVTSYQVHINNGASIASVIQALANFQIVAGAQANLKFFAVQDGAHGLADDPGLAGLSQEGDAAQYALGKLGLVDVHRQLRGGNVTVAVIDSQIDVMHPDLDGVIADSFDAVGAAEAPHPHGTGMAGAIASHRRLMGIAPSARIYAVHAFSSAAATAESTTFSILKGLDWAASKGVRVINMSFAGPRDPSLERAIKNAHDRGIVLIAAAGNAGPKSPPLYPGADPNVIAVTATDVDDKIFSGANRGAYIAVAAPGVDILVPAPDASYQLTTGTSVASAEVSGVAALLLERNPKLTPDDVRTILTTSARKLGASTDFGSGLVNPSKAIQTAGDFTTSEITATVPLPSAAPKPPAAAPRPAGSRPVPEPARPGGPKPASAPAR